VNWKGELLRFLFDWGFPAAGALAALWALRTTRLDALPAKRWNASALAAWVASRLVVHVLAFHMLGRGAGSGDLQRVWGPAARAVLDGTDPVEHLDNLYGPLFPWVLASGLGAGGGGYAPAIGLPFLLADALGLVLLRRLSVRHLGDVASRRLTAAVLLAPFTWFLTVVNTQDEALFSCALLATVAALDAGRERIGGLAAAAGTWLTKALFPFWAFPVLLAAGGGANRTILRTVAAAALTLGGLFLAAALGWNALGQVRDNIDTRGSTSWFLFVDAAKGVGPRAATAGLAATALACVVAALAALRVREGESLPDRAARGVTAVQAAYVVATPFLLSAHLAQGFALVMWLAVRRGAADARPPRAALVLGAGTLLWQIPGLGVRAEEWHRHPWVLLLPWVAFWAWTGVQALYDAPERRATTMREG
jgi:hypothetical protein